MVQAAELAIALVSCNIEGNEWFSVSIDGEDLRCSCGCVAEETYFQTASGKFLARDLIKIQKNNQLADLLLLSNHRFSDYEPADYFPVEDVVSGPERKPAVVISTEGDRTITVSDGHPVVIVEDPLRADVQKMVTADQVRAGHYLMGDDGLPILVEKVERKKYQGQMVNFMVKNRSHMAYPNGFKMGDNAWQQYLAKTDARILTVADIVAAIEEAEKNK